MSDEGKERRGVLRWVVGLVGGALVLYAGTFLLIVLDEVVFETDFLMDWIPSEAQGPISVFYYPLIWLFESFIA